MGQSKYFSHPPGGCLCIQCKITIFALNYLSWQKETRKSCLHFFGCFVRRKIDSYVTAALKVNGNGFEGRCEPVVG